MQILTSDIFTNDDNILDDSQMHPIAVFEFLSDTKRFLDENYRGCCKIKSIQSEGEVIMIRAYEYANFLKTIFNAVRASHLIEIDATFNPKSLNFYITLDTSLISGDTESKLIKIAENSGFTAEFKDGYIEVSFTLLDAKYFAFQAVSSSFIYNTLKKAFAS